MFCPKCGNQLPDGSKFCGVCGEKLADIYHAVDAVPNEAETNSTEVATENGKTKKKTTKKIFIIITVLAILAAVVLVAGRLFFGIGEKISLVYLSDGKYKFIPDIKEDVIIDIASSKSEDEEDLTIKFSPDGKYIYYFTQYDSYYGKGTLCRVKYNKLKENSANNNKYIEIIDKNVMYYFDFAGKNYLVYMTDDNDLYCYDGKKSVRIDKNVHDYKCYDSGKVVYTKGCAFESEEEKFNYTIYGVNLKESENIQVLARKVSSVISWEYMDNIYYYQDDDLYMTNFAGKELKLWGNVEGECVGKNGDIYFSVDDGKNFSLYNCVEDSGDESYKNLRKQLKDKENDVNTYTIYHYDKKNNETLTISRNVVDVEIYKESIMYLTIENIKEKIDIEDISSTYDLCNKMLEVYSGGKNNIICLDGTAYQLSNEAAEFLGETCVYDDVELFALKEEVYMLDSEGGLYRSAVKDGIAESFEIVAEDVETAAARGSKIYYMADIYSEDYYDLGTFYSCKKGKIKQLADDIFIPLVSENGCVMGITEIDDNDAFSIILNDKNGNEIFSWNAVKDFMLFKDLTMAYISNDVLYYYDGEETRKIDKGIESFWSEDQAKWYALNFRHA